MLCVSMCGFLSIIKWCVPRYLTTEPVESLGFHVTIANVFDNVGKYVFQIFL